MEKMLRGVVWPRQCDIRSFIILTRDNNKSFFFFFSFHLYTFNYLLNYMNIMTFVIITSENKSIDMIDSNGANHESL